MLTDLRLEILSLLCSAVKLPQDLCHIFHHTRTIYRYTILKNNVKNSKILTYLTQYHRLALLLTKLTKQVYRRRYESRRSSKPKLH